MAYDEELAARIRERVGEESDVTERKMFGGIGFMIGGNMAVAASSTGGMMVRVDPADTPELVAEPHAKRFEMRGRQMDGWLLVDLAGLRSADAFERWTALGIAYAKSLPPK